jgi:hypothetical protein
MDELKPVLVTIPILQSENRDTEKQILFLYFFLDYFFEKSHMKFPVTRVALEIIKNVYDHSGADGYMTVIDDGDVLLITIGDYGKKKINITSLRSGEVEWVKKTKHNFGHGLRKIFNLEGVNHLKLSVLDKSPGLHYELRVTKEKIVPMTQEMIDSANTEMLLEKEKIDISLGRK